MICAISSSIANFQEKILKRYKARLWHPLWDVFKPVMFFGLYHWLDYLLYAWHRGDKKVVWCGSDILHLADRPLGNFLIKLFAADHICENEKEQDTLAAFGIIARGHYNFYGNPNDYPVSFSPSKTPHVFMHCHGGKDTQFAREQCGLPLIERIASKVPEVTFHIYGRTEPNHRNIVFHGHIPEAQFNEEIRRYHAGLRLHQFDGVSEIMVKSVLLGQYPITTIPYPLIDCAENDAHLVSLLKQLKNKTKPNTNAREFWYYEVSQPL